MSQVTCITFLKYTSVKDKVWAFGMMQYAHKYFVQAEGLSFYKLLGTGKGLGFNPLLDWSTYAILTVWSDKKKAQDFIQNSILFKNYKSHASNMITIYMTNIKSHGLWSGQNPFNSIDENSITNQKICVITRATIRKRMLFKFWKYVPTSHKPLTDNPDLIYTKGIGEIPIIQMATFSIWNNLDAINQFAYKSKEHNTAIQMTRKLNWYKEELFARFIILKTDGDWPMIGSKILET